MSVSIEKNGPVTTIILNRPEARNAVDRPTAEALQRPFESSMPMKRHSLGYFLGPMAISVQEPISKLC